MKTTLVYTANGQPVKIGDKVPGKRLGKFYAHVEAIHEDSVTICCNGDVRSHRVSLDVIDAACK